MTDLSIVIPARNELYIAQVVDDLFRNLTGDTEVITVLDGYWPKVMPKDNPRLVVVHREQRGMRASINAGMAIAKGKYICKLDAHCKVAPGFDQTMIADCDGDWVVVPRRYSLEYDAWDVKRYRPFVDYEYLAHPYRQKKIVHKERVGLHAWVWDQRMIDRIDKQIDENMTFQGSCYVMTKKHWDRRIGKLSDEGYGSFIGEAQEVGLKTWLGGGKVMTNKKTWYAHLWKGQPYRDAYRAEYGIAYTRIGPAEFKSGNLYSVDYWMGNKWEGRKHDLSWLLERFWPVPSWDEDRTKWTH